MMVLSVRLTLLDFGQRSNLEREREVIGQHSRVRFSSLQ